MRSMLLASLVVLGLVVTDVRAGAARVTIRPAVRGAPARLDEQKLFAQEIQGTWKGTREEALQNALEVAQVELGAYLRNQDPPVEWTPPLEYIRRHLVKDTPKYEEQKLEEPLDGRPVFKYQARVRVEMTARDQEKVFQEERKERARQRMLVLAKVVAAVTVLLAAVGGYVRLDERTKGYYSTLLRLAVVCLIAAVGAGLWWLS
jgi:hypothetical protein